ncbi:MAG: NIPSNAP family protein [Prosthecobacter sp.]|nr:NIPSNAP family protein [Prosthecobacter sp.]
MHSLHRLLPAFATTVLLASLLISGICQAQEAKPVYEMRTYVALEGRLDALLKRFREHTCTLFEKHGMKNIGYWVPLDKADGADTTLIYILSHASLESAKASWKAFSADPEWQAARKASEADGKILARAPESVFLSTTDYSPPVVVKKADKDRVFELRIYTTPAGRLPDLHRRFRDHTMALFTKHGMTHIGYWSPLPGQPDADVRLTYILAHDSRDAGQAAFTAFRADPAWITAKAESEKNGSLTISPGGVKSIYMRALDFSPIQ